MKKLIPLIGFLVCCKSLPAQYTVNGSAQQFDCNCHQLTAALNNQSGSVWNNTRIDLNQSFTFNFEINLGLLNAGGADGIAFVLQPISTGAGSIGGGLGYNNISPAVGVTLDTHQNPSDADPVYDHIAIQLNGNLNHASINNIAGPVNALNGYDNIEDGINHSLRIQWDAVTKTLSAYTDDNLRVSVSKDLIVDVFGGNNMLYWGFTGSTGALANLQQFCRPLKPFFYFTPNQKACVNEPILFYDSTISYTTLKKLYWDFGDGSPIDSVNVNPVHVYRAAGNYTVLQKVVNADGCHANNPQIIRVGPKPVANFGYNAPLCDNSSIQFKDSSLIGSETITHWEWINKGNLFSTQQNPSQNFSAGSQTVGLIAISENGCLSDTLFKTLFVNQVAVVAMNFNNACKNTTANFTATDTSATVTKWKWSFGDGTFANTQNAQHRYTANTIYPVKLLATAANGCSSLLQRDIIIYSTNAFAGNDTITPSGRPLQLQASGGIGYEWIPATNLNNPFISNPLATLTGTQIYTYTLRAYTPSGCETFDEIKIQAYKAPEIYLPNAFTPGGNTANYIYRAFPVAIKEFKFLKIFNRYGQEIFNTTNAQVGWDGTFKGKAQGSGVYVVIASGVDYRGLVVDRQGTVILIR